MSEDNKLKQAQDLVKSYSFSFTHPTEVSRELQKFADAKSLAEQDKIFEKITNYGSVFKDKDTLRTALDQLFDKQQEMAVTVHPIQPKVAMPTAEPKPISNVPLNNNKINQPNKANTLQTEPVIVEINNRKYAVCVQDNEKYLVGLQNQATNAMISAYNAKNGIKNLFSNNDLNNIKQITVNDKPLDIFCGTITKGGQNSVGHTVEIVIHKDTDGKYKTNVLDQTTYINSATGAEHSDAKQEHQTLYTKQIKQIYLNIQNKHPNIQFDNNINFHYGVYPTEVASCSEVMAYFTDDLIKENFNVNKALTHIKEKISLPRMASMRFKATCTAMQQIEMKFNAAGLESIPLNKLNKIRNSPIIDDMGFLRKLTDAEYTQLTGIKVPVKTTQLSVSPLQPQIAEQQVHKPENLDPQLPNPALRNPELRQKTPNVAQDVAVNKVTTVTKEQTEINRNNPNNSLEQARQLVQEYSICMEDENKKSLDGALEMFASTSYGPKAINVCFNTICKLGNVPSDESHLLRAKLDQLFSKQQDVTVNLDTTQPKVAMPTAEPKSTASVALNPQLPTPALHHGVASIAKDVKSFISSPNAVTQRGPNKTAEQIVNVIHALNDNNDLPEIMGEEKAKEFQATTKLMTEHCQKGNMQGVQQGFARLNELCADQPNTQNTSTGQNLLKVISSAALVIVAVIACKFNAVSTRVQKFKESVRNLVKSDHKFSESLSKTRGLDTNNHSVNRMQNVGSGR
ncbi:MAG: hypothetical protein PV347_07120 [Rickettsiaceae bacterium]|nr:hypothetical protein [Rickettsiaceae bacterium]MDD9337444.1 hypothetical protein [Rickettsiaceae bacterium]